MKGPKIKRVSNIIIGIIGLVFSGHYFYEYFYVSNIKDLIVGIIFAVLGLFLILKDSKKMKEFENKKLGL